MIYFRQIEGNKFTKIEKLSSNSVRMPIRLRGIEFGEQRNYKVAISISCSGPKSGKVKSSKLKVLRKREEADLLYTTNDADWMYTWSMKDFNEKGYDSGKREKHIRLVNPNYEELDKAIIAAGQYLKSFKNKKDWKGGELLIIYAGHGLEGDGALYISGFPLTAKLLVERITENLPLSDELCRIDLIIDSCHSGAFIGNFLFESYNFRNKIFPFELFGSCLHDESSLECSAWEHGILTYSFKKNFEVNPFEEPEGEDLIDWQETVKNSLFQGGVVYLSEGEQHAFNLRNGFLKVYGSTRFFDIFEELGRDQISINDFFEMMNKQRQEISLIDFSQPYHKEMFGVFM